MSNRIKIGVDLVKTSFAVVILNSVSNELSHKKPDAGLTQR
ncbi:MAG: hypothetical protein ACK5ME_01390 [Parahaliea sp.]